MTLTIVTVGVSPMNNSTRWPLLAKYLSGECTSLEKNEIETWINEDSDNQELVKYLKIAWNTAEPEIQTSNTNILWQQLSRKAEIGSGLLENPTLPFNKPIAETKKWSFASHFYRWRYAAVFLIFFLTTLYLFNGDLTSLLGINDKTVLKTIALENGQREIITLSDGSKITLDAGSKFSYPGNFTGDTRQVYLAGEAFFEAASNPEKPFIVVANHAAVEVLGTKFNIRAWQQEQKITVTVTEGSVLLYPEKDSTEKSITLNQGYASTLPADGPPTLPRLVDVRKSTGWMQNEIYFEDTRLGEILSQLERWYDVEFETRDSMVMNDRLTVHLGNKPLEDHLKLLGELVDVHFARTGKLYRLMPM
jgi:transmembrane sensor